LGSGVDLDLHTFIVQARISAAKKPHCSSPSRASRQAALQAAIPGQLRLVRQADHHQQHAELRLGAHHHAQRRGLFAGLGPINSGGTVIFSVSGPCRRKPCNLELPMGIPFKDLMELCGGVWKGRKLKAVIPRRSSCMVVPAEIMWKYQYGLRLA